MSTEAGARARRVPGGEAGALRLALVRTLHAEGLDLPAAREAADALLLVGLAAAELGIHGAADALRLATVGCYAAARRVWNAVGLATGLPLGLPLLPSGVVAAVTPTGADPFEKARASPDPFGRLAQLLRAHSVRESGGALVLAAHEAQKDEGGFYTPWPLAKRLAKELLGGPAGAPGTSFDEVPTLLDPACGSGTFLVAAFDVLHEALEARARRDPSIRVEPVAWTVAALHGVETDRTALLAARLAVVVRAVKADRAGGKRASQLALFGQAKTYGPLVADRLRLGDALADAPRETLPGTARLARRLQARDTPGQLPQPVAPGPVRWDADYPLRFSDEEGTFRAGGGFDRILANPPYVPVDRIPDERRAQLMGSLRSAQRRFDLFIGFVERALTLLSPGGRATLLIPRTFLTETNAERCRRLLLDEATVERIEELGPVKFDGATLECIALTFAARHAGDAARVEVVRGGQAAEVPQELYRKAPRAMMRPELADPGAEESLRLAELSVPLGRWFCASWGARGTPVRDFHLDSPSHPLARPMLKGDDVAPLRLRASSRWLLYDTERLYRPSRPEFFESRKILVAKVTGARGLVAAVDEGGHYTDDSVACVVRKADLAAIPPAQRKRHQIAIGPLQPQTSLLYDLHLVAALVQTPLVQSYYRVRLGGGLNVFPELIELLPLPRPERLQLPEAAELSSLARGAAGGAEFDLARADLLARALYGL